MPQRLVAIKRQKFIKNKTKQKLRLKPLHRFITSLEVCLFLCLSLSSHTDTHTYREGGEERGGVKTIVLLNHSFITLLCHISNTSFITFTSF